MKITLNNNQLIENVKEIEITHHTDNDCFLTITLDNGNKRRITSYGVKKIEN